MILVGMCGLVESLLTNLALEAEAQTVFRLADIRGMGRKQLQIFLTRTERLDFGRLVNWPRFGKLYKLRNVIVHGHGLVPDRKRSDLVRVVEELNMIDVLVGRRRIRMDHDSLVGSHSTIESLVEEITDLSNSDQSREF